MKRFHAMPWGTGLLTAAALLAAGLPAQAETLLGHDLSLPAEPYDWAAPPGTDIRWTDTYDIRKAVGVTLSPGVDYRFDSFTAMLAMVTGEPPQYLQTEQVHAAIFLDAAGLPGALLADLGTLELTPLQPLQAPFPAQAITWSAASPLLLLGGGTYWFMLNDVSQYSEYGVPVAHWTVMATGASTLPTGSASLAGYRVTYDGGANWSASGYDNAMRIEATAVPEPRTLALLLAGLGVVGGVALRRRPA